ncbi:hypothetical protein RZS08_49245, partial [Arthrospira platensis SPKY1]|nr:hypothetical protein [Arthrospira platensis SPKY1]
MRQIVNAGRDLEKKALFEERILLGECRTIAVAEEVERVKVGVEVEGKALPAQLPGIEKRFRPGFETGITRFGQKLDPDIFEAEPIIQAHLKAVPEKKFLLIR